MMKLVSDRELNKNKQSHVDQHDKLNMSVLKKNLFRTSSSISLVNALFCIRYFLEKSGWGMIFIGYSPSAATPLPLTHPAFTNIHTQT